MVTPELMVAMSKVGFMAPDGRSKTFDARANGFGRGEGCGVVVLKRLADAIADGDRVLAVMRGSAVNQDGHSTLLAAPNGLAQQRAADRRRWRTRSSTPARIGFVETHGTGTALGDPIEVEAIADVVGRCEPGAGPCCLGAVKANIGHLEAAAGVVGLIKSVLVLRHERGAAAGRTSRSSTPTSRSRAPASTVPTALTPWPAGRAPRCAGVSSFGVGGTNAHVVLEEAPMLPGATARAPTSSSDPAALGAQPGGAARARRSAGSTFSRETPSSVADALLHRRRAAQRTSTTGSRWSGARRTNSRVRLGEWLTCRARVRG